MARIANLSWADPEGRDHATVVTVKPGSQRLLPFLASGMIKSYLL